jgi:uncharacterized protein YjdB
MQRPNLRSLSTFVYGSRGCVKVILLLLCFICATVYNSSAAVTVSTSSTGLNICSNKAVTGSTPGFTTLGTIMISEGSNADINGATGGITNTIVLVPPTGWQFSTTLPTFTFTAGSNITAVTGSITSTALTVNITANNTNGGDQVFISGLQVQATSTSSAAGYIYPTSVVGIAGISTGTSGTNFSSLSLTSPLTPSVAIAASPAGAVCPGVNVIFSPTPVNGGTSPVYQWYVNGSNVATGATYSNSTLMNGNTIACTMVSGLGCVTSTSVASNTLTMTVNAAPAAITGSNITCPGSSTSLSSATGGGTWNSSNTGIATVNSSGVVSGVAAGSAKISYTAAGCPAVRTVYVNAAPTVPSLTPTTSVVCSGSSVTISSAGTPLPTSILSQNFNSGITPWTVDTAGSVGILPGAEWKSCGDGYINEQGLYHSPDNSAFAMSNSDTSGSASYTSSRLISPAFSLAGYSSAVLSFQHAYEHWLAGDYNVDVEISTNGGASWSTLRSYTGTDVGMRTAFAADTLSLNAYLGYTSVKIRFNYYCHWGYYWAVDNVMITGVSAIAYPTWSPAATLYTDPALTTPYIAGTQTNTVYAAPTTGGTSSLVTYTATATIPGCSATATSAVTVNPVPGTIMGVLTTCVGSTTTLGNSVGGGTWSSVNTAVGTVNSSGVVAGVAAGTSLISYSSGGSCAATAVVTVIAVVGTIASPSAVCLGSTATLLDATPGGTWSSNNTAIATIGSTTGIVNGLALGTVVITYSLGAGCAATRLITVYPLPAAITGMSEVCQTQTITLSDATTGGTWSSSAAGIAVVGSISGIVSGVSPGTTTITYTSSAGCTATRVITVHPQASITGTLTVCMGLTTSLGNVNSGGTWFCATSLAWVSSTGVVTGMSAGIAGVTYVLPTGCTSTALVTINPLPPAITGVATVCAGAVTTLSNSSLGGTWSSDNTAIAEVGSATGAVSGITAGTATITYTLSSGCIATRVVTVNPLPDPITGSSSVCVSYTITLSDVTTGGTWSSSNATIASVGSTTGAVYGAVSNTVNITYTLPTGCVAVKAITVNGLPAAIGGTGQVCLGLTTTLTNATSGGTWSSGNVAVGTIGSSTGVLGGISAATAVVTYTLPTGCYIARQVTVNPLPDVISGPSGVCLGLTITLDNTATGGIWSSISSNVSVNATTGAVTGTGTGAATITYTLATGCSITKVITVNPLPLAVAGGSNVCVGSTLVLTDATTGGTWSSSNTAVGTINSSGVVYGLANGVTTITYTLPTGCVATTPVSVNPLPAAIGGATNVCLAASTSLTDATPGGSWISSNSTIAVVGSSSGVVTGYTIGTAVITYMMPGGCYVVSPMVVNSLPLSISGPGTVCQGYSILLSDVTPGGSWVSSNTSVATVTSGVVAGLTTGTTIISYVLPTGCFASKNVIVNTTPAAITGTTGICQGSTTTLADATSGGVWGVGTPSVAVVGATGVVTGLSPGTTLVSYTLGSCYAITVVTVYVVPPSITGVNNICQGATITLTNSVGGGSWVSTSSVAAIGSTSGVVTGMGAGTAIISYILPTGCYVAMPFTVNALPAAITGSTSLCVGASVLYGNTTSGGTWSSSNPSVAGISSSGLAIGYLAGNTTISYTLSTGCGAAVVLTVNAIPASVTGPSIMCEGSSVTLSSATIGGTWSSSNGSVAGVGTGGIVSGVATGVATISYTVGGCTVLKSVTVNATPQPITGITSICYGVNTTLSSLTSGGTWSSGSGIATIGSASGIAVAMTPGTAMISYTLGGCSATTVLVVNTVSPITGPGSVCTGSVVTLSNSTSGGSWTSGNVSIAFINAASGSVNGMSVGTAGITYTMLSGCKAVTSVVVNASPAAITGTAHVCPGFTTTLSDLTGGGTWVSGNNAIAGVGSGSGIVTGVTSGTANISYVLTNGCMATVVFTTDAIPPSITGGPNVCVGGSALLSNAAGPGTWVSSNTSVAGINPTSGLVLGYAVGTSTITYTSGVGCSITLVISVNSAPASITGPSSVCQGLTLTLNDITPGGTWSSSNTTIAVVGTSGIVLGLNGGVTTIYYTLSSGCAASKNITVNTLPSSITGSGSVCVGQSTTLNNATTGGTWTSSNVSIATVGYTSGIVNGLVAGPAVITYTPTSGCITTLLLTVNALPSAITGASSVCVAATTTLTNASGGGTWSSSNAGVAMVGSSSGIVTGVSSGTAVITYTAGIGCWVVTTVTTHPSPVAISGPASVCLGSSVSLTDGTSGGSWSSTNTTVGSINTITGVVSGLAIGTTTISYTIGTGCAAVLIATVSPIPGAISGLSSVCAGSAITLTNSVSGGSWSSSNIALATAGSASGVIGGVAGGIPTITYILPGGCYTVTPITVNALPTPISGTLGVCPGFSSSLSSTPGGLWSSSNTTSGTINATSGVVMGISSGSTIISYVLPTGCVTTAVVTVNILYPITGVSAICAGQSITLNNAMGSGTWTSSNGTVASVGLTSGIVTGNAAGTAIITFAYTSSCRATAIVSVNTAPSAIGGTTTVCTGSVTTLTNSISGGTWSSGATGIATVGLTGIVTGVAQGTAVISYSLGSGCRVTTIVTVNQGPAAILGSPTVCQSLTTVLSNATPGGTWSSSNSAIAGVSSSGVVTGSGTGTAIISYSLGNGCYSALAVTVSALSPITGGGNVCIGIPTTLTNTAPGGTWTSTNPSIASIDASGGVVTGLATGTTLVTYAYGTGCWVTTTISVNPLPAAITGPSNVCAGYNITLSDATGGGTWSTTGYTTIATIGAGTGILTGGTAGAAVVTYALPTGCVSTYSVTVNALPSVIGGTAQVCVTGTTLLTNTTPGGAWSSGNTSVATINATSGVVAGVNAGTVNITYGISSGCFISTVVTVNALPAPITGSLGVCVGSSSSLSCSTPGGMWSSSNTAVGTVGVSTGVMGGIASGTNVITYVLPTGCASIAMATVNALPTSITGPNKVCVGSSITLSSTPLGGTWSSGATNVSVGGSTGIVSGITAGPATITYSAGAGCFITTTITVNPLPAFITGALSICEAASSTLANITTGGTWSCIGPVAGVGSGTGIVTGFTSGTAPVTYTLASGCYRVAVVTVNALPAAIDGAATVCSGQTTTLSNTTTGGAWSSGTPAVATVNSATGVVTGVSGGTTNIIYTTAAGCITSKILTVNPSPVAITGASQVCAGSITTLSNTTIGGVWSSSNTSVASISASGVIAGLVAGTSVISYTLLTGCAAEVLFAVNPLPAPITGPMVVCSGSVVSLSSVSAGGSWTSSNVIVALAGAVGDVSGMTPGAANITYTLPTGCFIFRGITVNPVPAPITGIGVVCQGYTTTLSSTTPAGTWSSVIPGIASVGSSTGIVTGVSDGIASISYTLANGCAATLLYTVHPLAAINGPANACLGQTTLLSNLIAGGTWSSSNIAVATVGSASGDVYGVALGTATISYTMPTGCMSTKNITVNPVPAPIAGGSSACMGYTIPLTDATPGGMWSSSATAIAPVSSSGVVTGVSAGSAIIVYALSTGCASYATVNINPLYPIVGTPGICGNDTITFTNTAPGGLWTSANPGVATINAATGFVSGVVPGTTVISYLLPTGCLATKVVTVNTQPALFSVTGGGGFCIGSAGVPVGLNSSVASVNYKLFNGSTFVASYPGTGSALSFGTFTTTGTYTVLATSTISGCSRNMAGVAVVSMLPYNSPSVTVTTTTAGLICMGSLTTFVPTPVYGGTAPTYEWRVNGVIVGLGGSYIYTPASGDVVTCKMTSNAACISPDTASGSMIVSLVAPSVPAVSIAATPGDTMCPMTTVSITPTPVNGGSAPSYTWMVNGMSAGVSPTYSYAPLHGDVVYCIMHSNQFCLTSDTVSSNHKVFTVYPATSPTVTITASPGLFIIAGTSDTLTASVSGGGSAPAYQWVLNGAVIPGATNAFYVSSTFANNDSICCIVTNTDTCAGSPGSSCVVTSVKQVGLSDLENGLELSILPNPNTGLFTLQGTIQYTGDVAVEVTNLLGQSVYQAIFVSHGKRCMNKSS